MILMYFSDASHIGSYDNSFQIDTTAYRHSLLLCLLAVSALFVSYFAFDTLGDSHGWQTGLGAAGALTGAALAVMLGYSCYCHYPEDRTREGCAAPIAPSLRASYLRVRSVFAYVYDRVYDCGCVCVRFCGSLVEGIRNRDAGGGIRESEIKLSTLNASPNDGTRMQSTQNPLADARWSAGPARC
jgi:hypothetical protein